MIDEINAIPTVIVADVDVFANFQVTLGAQDKSPPVAPGPRRFGIEPVNAAIGRGPGIKSQAGFTEILETRRVRVSKIFYAGKVDGGIGGPGVMQELLELVGTDIGQDAPVTFLLEKPVGTSGRRQVVRRDVQHLQHAPDNAVADQVAGMPGRFVAETFRVTDHVLAAGRRDPGTSGCQLIQRGER